jgi:exonuclease VII large subunit
VYALLQAHVSEHISFKARAQAVILIQQEQPEVLQLQDTDPESFQQLFEGIVAERIQLLTEELVAQEQPSDDPLVRLKQQELDLRAMDMQRRGEEFVAQEQRKANEFDQRIDLEKMEREDAEEAGKERIRVADDKLDIMRDKLKADKSKGDE